MSMQKRRKWIRRARTYMQIADPKERFEYLVRFKNRELFIRALNACMDYDRKKREAVKP